MRIGYARVSTSGQSLDVQRAKLEGNIDWLFSEKESGAKADRPELAKAIAKLKAGDVLVVTKVDRLARSTRDLYNILKLIEDKGAGFKSLDEPMIDTTTPHGKLIFAILGAVAEFERSMILTRTNEGRNQAKEKGIKFGPKFLLSEEQKAEIRRMLDSGRTQREIAALFKVSQPTIMRAYQR